MSRVRLVDARQVPDLRADTEGGLDKVLDFDRESKPCPSLVVWSLAKYVFHNFV